MQAKDAVVSYQTSMLKMYCNEFEELLNVVFCGNDGVDTILQAVNALKQVFRIGNRYVSRAGALCFIKGLGLLVFNTFDVPLDSGQGDLLEGTSEFALDLCDCIDNLVDLPADANEPMTTGSPLVRPCELLSLRRREFHKILESQRVRLSFSFTDSEKIRLNMSLTPYREPARVVHLLLKLIKNSLTTAGSLMAIVTLVCAVLFWDGNGASMNFHCRGGVFLTR